MGCGASVVPAPDDTKDTMLVTCAAKCLIGGADIGGSVCNPDIPVGKITIVPVQPMLELGTVLVFDNKGKDAWVDTAPRVGILVNQNGEVHVICKGSSPVITAQDLECIQLVDCETSTYAAFTSLGRCARCTMHCQFELWVGACNRCRVYTFIIACNQGELECIDVAQGQLPVGDGESFGSWKDHNRTNIETAWLMRDSLSPTGRTLFWVCALWLV